MTKKAAVAADPAVFRVGEIDGIQIFAARANPLRGPSGLRLADDRCQRVCDPVQGKNSRRFQYPSHGCLLYPYFHRSRNFGLRQDTPVTKTGMMIPPTASVCGTPKR